MNLCKALARVSISTCVHVAETRTPFHLQEMQRVSTGTRRVPFNNTEMQSAVHVCRYKQCDSLTAGLALRLYFSLYDSCYWKGNRHESRREQKNPADVSECHLAGEIKRMLGDGRQNCHKLKNHTGNNLLGLSVSRHSTFRMGSATLIERERELGKREKSCYKQERDL